MVMEPQSLSELSAEQLRELTSRLLVDVRHKQAVIDKLTHENAVLKRLKFAAQSERYSAEQRSLLEETLDADLQAVSDEIGQLTSGEAAPRDKQQPKRQPLPASLPRREIRHEPESTICRCGCQMKRIGEDVATSSPMRFIWHPHLQIVDSGSWRISRRGRLAGNGWRLGCCLSRGAASPEVSCPISSLTACRSASSVSSSRLLCSAL